MLLRVSRGRRVETIWLRSRSEATGAVMTWVAFGSEPKAEPEIQELRESDRLQWVSRPGG